MVKQAFEALPYSINTVLPVNAKSVLLHADVIMIGGGNTFKLLHDIYDYGLFEIIVNKVKSGTPYIGWSAGATLQAKLSALPTTCPSFNPNHLHHLASFLSKSIRITSIKLLKDIMEKPVTKG
jgi:dipeptidase E